MEFWGTDIKTRSPSLTWVMVHTPIGLRSPDTFSKVLETRRIGPVGCNVMRRTTRVPKVASTGPVSVTTPLVIPAVKFIESNPRGGGQGQVCGDGQTLSPPKLPGVFHEVDEG